MTKTTVLSAEQTDFLEEFRVRTSTSPDAIPVYMKDGNDYVHVPGYACEHSERKAFLSGPAGLFLSGAAVFVRINEGVCVVPDDRKGGFWKATIQGWSRLDEGGDPLRTALREGHEEIVAFYRDNDECIELVPEGAHKHQTAASIAVMLNEHQQYGRFELVRVNENFSEKVIEFVYQWDLCSIPGLMLAYEEDFFRGGRMGASVYVLDRNRQLVGVFSGQQGFLPLTTMTAVHPVVEQSWEKLW